MLEFTYLSENPEGRKPHPADDLNSIMEFDHVIRVHSDGTITDWVEPAPEVCVELDEDGQIVGDAEKNMIESVDLAGWELMTGYTGQHGYHGPIMHPSEYVGGKLAEDILEVPGLYVVTEVTGLSEDTRDGDPIGWVIARKLSHGRQLPESMSARLHRQRIR